MYMTIFGRTELKIGAFERKMFEVFQKIFVFDFDLSLFTLIFSSLGCVFVEVLVQTDSTDKCVCFCSFLCCQLGCVQVK